MTNFWDNSVTTNPFFSGIAREFDAQNVTVPDQGCPSNSGTRYIGSQDGRISICEAARTFGNSSFDPRLQRIFLQATGEPLPWIISDPNAIQTFRIALLHWRNRYPQDDSMILRELLSWYLEPSPRGLGMHMQEGLPEVNAEEAIQARPDQPRGDCTEAVYSLTAYLHRAGFLPEVIYTEFPRRVSTPQGLVTRTVTHMILRVPVNGQYYYLDPGASAQYRFRTQFATPEMPYARENVINYSQVLAWYYSNQANDLGSQRPLPPHTQRRVIALYQRAQLIDPSNPNFYFNLATFYSTIGDEIQALRTYYQLLRIDPNYSTAHYQIGRILRGMGREQDATLYFRRAIALASTSPASRYLVAQYRATLTATAPIAIRRIPYRRTAGVR